jgi:hypothetical protein
VQGYQPSTAVAAVVNATNKTMQSNDKVKTFIFHNLKGDEYPVKKEQF